MLDNLIIGVFVISCSGFLFSLIRPYFKSWVNCWFCNKNQWVAYAKRNAFTCDACQQYNGFTKSGDYNRTMSKMFSEAANSVSSAIQAVAFGSPKIPATNGLCDTCNRLQGVLMERLHKFEPLNEDDYFDEYEAYKHRLNLQYPLCERCEAFTMQKLRLNQANFGSPPRSTVSGFAGPPSSSSVSSTPSRDSPLRKKHHDHASRRRKLFFAAGAVTNTATVMNLLASLLLFVVFFETTPAELPFHLLSKDVALRILPLAPAITTGSMSAFFIGFRASKSRITFLDLLGSVAWPLFTTFCFMDFFGKHDYHTLGTSVSAFLSLLSLASLLVPRKRKHIKRPNTIYSAFSIASTPISQCSSRFTASRANLSILPDDVAGIVEDEPMDTSDNADVPDFNDRDNHSLFVGATPSSKKSKSFLQYRQRKEVCSREGTPTREIHQGLDKLNIDDISMGGNITGNDDSFNFMPRSRTSLLSAKALTPSKTRINSPFSSMTFNSNVRQSQPFTISKGPKSTASNSTFSMVTAFSTPSSKFSSVSSPNNRFRAPPKPPLSFAPSSEFTSVSQQHGGSNTPTYLAWLTAIVALLAFILQSVYIFFYHQPNVVVMPAGYQNYDPPLSLNSIPITAN